MAKVAVFIHGMWGTTDVWRNWRAFLEARGRQTIAPSLRHHDAPPLAPAAGLGTTSLGDYVADVTKTTEGLAEKPVPIGHSLAEALLHAFNMTDRRQGTELHCAFVHDSGCALLEIAIPWLDAGKTTTVEDTVAWLDGKLG